MYSIKQQNFMIKIISLSVFPLVYISCPRYKNENARLVRAFSFFIVPEQIEIQADPDTRSVTGEVPQFLCGILFIRRSVAKAWPPLRKRPIPKSFGLFFFITPLRTHKLDCL
jgi:hypothetical protein